MPKAASPIPLAFVVARRALKLHQEEMAKRLGISRRTLSRWEHGHIVPSLDDRVRVLASLGDVPREVRTPLGVAFGLLAPGAAATPPPPDGAAAARAVDDALRKAASALGIEPNRLSTAILCIAEAAEAHRVRLTAVLSAGPDIEVGEDVEVDVPEEG